MLHTVRLCHSVSYALLQFHRVSSFCCCMFVNDCFLFSWCTSPPRGIDFVATVFLIILVSMVIFGLRLPREWVQLRGDICYFGLITCLQ